ncbi:MAG TPA: response regulator [Kiritimatiellia bacterium]|nr:response regulator [Kiritimatiellia bacterium]HRZ12964.1 response regulator [Kiritimatiellia bacterium]HSA18426.1 response regulator [Kiritimatiellia bacterium]
MQGSDSAVLVVDDENGPRESLRILLKNEFRVLCADSVDTATTLLAQERPSAIILDIRMPGKNGIDGLREMRGLDQDVSIILLTGYSTLETAQEAVRLGANDYIKKPFDASEMLDVVRHGVLRTELERRRRKAEEQLNRLNRNLQERIIQSDPLVSMGSRAAELAHDIRNPLTLVLGYVELLSVQLREAGTILGDKWPATRSYLEMIETSVLRCKEMADTWTSEGRHSRMSRGPVDILALVMDLASTMTAWAQIHGAEIRVRSDAHDLRVNALRLQLLRAVQNLMVNAVDAVRGKKGGLVEVRVRREKDNAIIEVADNGPGITAKTQQNALAAPTSEPCGLPGMGLRIVRQIVEEHGGRLMLASQPGEGAIATLQLPLLS